MSNNESLSAVENRVEQSEGGGLCEECVSEDVCDDMTFFVILIHQMITKYSQLFYENHVYIRTT